jgi:V-type H+-transporting ATPase subunit a
VVGDNFEWVYLKDLSKPNCTFPMGVDPVWSLSDQKITFSNGIKMKMSVIMGVLHMQMGIFIKGTNSIYHGRWADLFTEVIAGTIILLGLFGWMDLLIFAKWFLPMDIQTTDGTKTN